MYLYQIYSTNSFQSSRFTSVHVPQTLWKLVQLLILGSTAVNFFIYASMSAVLRKTFLSFLPCSKWWTITKLGGSSSKDLLQEHEPSDLVLSLWNTQLFWVCKIQHPCLADCFLLQSSGRPSFSPQINETFRIKSWALWIISIKFLDIIS